MRNGKSIKAALLLLLQAKICCAFTTPGNGCVRSTSVMETSPITITSIFQSSIEDDIPADDNTSIDDSAELFQQRQLLKLSLLMKAQDTKRGFQASKEQREEISALINDLSQLNPTSEPASSYYKSKTVSKDSPTIAGKWTLKYTDAPDITSLDPVLSSSNSALGMLPSPPPLSKLARIGQDYEKGSKDEITEDGPRILQKVVCEASADPSKPTEIDLTLVGFELIGDTGTKKEEQSNDGEKSNPLNPFGLPLPIPDLNQLQDGPAAVLEANPIKLRGPLKSPFGKSNILYLDEDMRILKTNQGYVAVNMRDVDPWF
ncbi:hypothetical protein CTEN210_03149 [Chaetoceros tenuissimus]|uniref:Plastid lipid-associated protein/fibrillin conserved domain-containing protein n=1 Tax=Chaetoceros tenuissimus TaxID=426638 RepID=A0AAD3CK99_9STRA|nr:hypothetical protein CTEN210_03149 [Chaetoceros tenuissimus]